MPSGEEPPPDQPQAEDDDEPDEISWNLGFLEEPEKPHLLLRHRFPSKIGGRPAWLDPVRLPSREMLTCRASGKPLDFLLQIYAPADVNPLEGFHRSLFLFISPEGSRLKEPGAVRLFRCQLPRNNPYYSSQPPRDKDKYPQPLSPSDQEASRERDPWRSVDAERPPPSATAASTSSPHSSGSGGGGGGKKRKGAAAKAAAAAATAAAATAAAAATGLPAATAASEVAGASGDGGLAAPLPRTGVRGPGGLYPELELVVEPEEDFEDEGEGEEEEEEDEDEWEEVVEGQAEVQGRQGRVEEEREGNGEGVDGDGDGDGDGRRRGDVGAAGTGDGGGGTDGEGGAGGGDEGETVETGDRQAEAAEAAPAPAAAAEHSAGRGVEAEVRRALQQYRERVAREGELDDEELPPDVVEAVEGAAAPEQRCFADFQARVSLAPDQVIRYCFQDGARPLWPAPHGRPGPGDIPPCPYCGAARKMEFQVLPQLLHYLRLDEEDPASPDWSCLVAYTCARSCSPPVGAECTYLEEVVWVQAPNP